MARKKLLPDPESGSPDEKLRCPWNDFGSVCGKRGSLTDSTLGEGPWYCPEHWWKLKGRQHVESERKTPAQLEVESLCDAKNYCYDHGLDTVDKQRAFVRAAVRNIGKGIVRDTAHWQRWAQETIARPDASGAALERAQQYLADHPLREPGDDDEEVAA